jgi:hypothetical protein
MLDHLSEGGSMAEKTVRDLLGIGFVEPEQRGDGNSRKFWP